jgi:hypothetical protein
VLPDLYVGHIQGKTSTHGSRSSGLSSSGPSCYRQTGPTERRKTSPR